MKRSIKFFCAALAALLLAPALAVSGAAPAEAVPIRGMLDSVSGGPGTLRVVGWAISGARSGEVRIDLDGRPHVTVPNDVFRSDVQVGFWNFYGFDTTIDGILEGRHTICVTALRSQSFPNTAEDTLLGCGTATVTPPSPIGWVDSADLRIGGSAQLRGWTIDPDVTGPVMVHLYVDGRFYRAIRADTPRPDVAAVYKTDGAHGFDLLLTGLGPGARTICAYGINLGRAAPHSLLGCRVVNVPSGAPLGAFDTASARSDGTVTITGWALDTDLTAPIPVHVYVDGKPTEVIANTARPDVAAVFPHFGDRHGFNFTFKGAPSGIRTVCVYAINQGAPLPNPLLGCKRVVIPGGAPFGYLDSATQIQFAGLNMRGWVIDPDTTGAASVHLYFDGKFIAAATANATRTDVGTAIPGYGNEHGFDVTASANLFSGPHQLCAYGINQPAGANPLLGCLAVIVPAVPPVNGGAVQ